MDVISVTDATLSNAYVILQRLDEDSETITSKCEQHLSSELNSLDENFRGEVQRYIEAINLLREKFKYCIDENMTAIRERIGQIPDYEKQTYRKRDIV